MNKIGVLLLVAGLFMLVPSIVNFVDFFPMGFFLMFFPFPYGLIIYYGVSLTLIGFGIKKIIRGSKTPKPAKQKPAKKGKTSAFCENCGNTLKPTAKFCAKCGNQV